MTAADPDPVDARSDDEVILRFDELVRAEWAVSGIARTTDDDEEDHPWTLRG